MARFCLLQWRVAGVIVEKAEREIKELRAVGGICTRKSRLFLWAFYLYLLSFSSLPFLSSLPPPPPSGATKRGPEARGPRGRGHRRQRKSSRRKRRHQRPHRSSARQPIGQLCSIFLFWRWNLLMSWGRPRLASTRLDERRGQKEEV